MSKEITVTLSDSQYKVLKLVAAMLDERPEAFCKIAVERTLEGQVDYHFEIHHPRRKELMEAVAS